VYLKKIDSKDVWVKGNFKTAETSFLTLEQLNDKLKTSPYGELKTCPLFNSIYQLIGY